MAVFEYKKYKISLHPDSCKTQGLQTGDIVRRQYFDGKTLIYSLLCVLDYGVESQQDGTQSCPYFIGALLEGNAPQSNEILDFARVTNLFDTDRSGALYFTASDAQAPYMDVIDGIGKNASLCWPESIAGTEAIDPTTQYVIQGVNCFECDYTKRDLTSNHSRICHLKRNNLTSSDFVGLKQDFYQYVANPNRVLISYKIKASSNTQATASLGYADDVRLDGTCSVNITTEWQYKLHAITVDWSGRHLRSFKLDLSQLTAGCEVWIADLNIILLSSIADFMDASQTRIGKLDGITDQVFGKLDGYGGYLQKLYASNSAHISGTLTAGDENGFGSTFYAGKIHRNVFLNSLDVNFASSVGIAHDVLNPTGVGKVYVLPSKVTMIAQEAKWLSNNVDKTYCFSFWSYAQAPCQLQILQNNNPVGTLQIESENTHAWQRLHISFGIITALNSPLQLSLNPIFGALDGDIDEQVIYFSAPQLESGKNITQYQPTDDVLDYTEDYGAWFSRGGVGGTMQNPLLKLNYDNEGGLGTRTNSFLLRTDGSGHLANKNISWDENGKVTFGDNVSLNWNNLDSQAQQAIASKSIRITGPDTFTLLESSIANVTSCLPETITLTLEEENLASTSSQRTWYYLNGEAWHIISGANAKTLIVSPDDAVWSDADTLTFKCEVAINSQVYSDTFTIRKQYSSGYTIKVTSTQGALFKNGNCSTTLKAQVYYNGNLVPDEEVAARFIFSWKKYNAEAPDQEDTTWFNEQYDQAGTLIQEAIDTTQQSITLGYQITGSDIFVCEAYSGGAFPYVFPIVF